MSRNVMAAALVAALAASACGGGGSIGGAAVPSVSPPGEPLTYVAIGASETVGIGADDPVREAWTQVFYRTALPRAAVFVNLGIPGAVVEDALSRELPEARQHDPDVVTVWLNVNDIIAGVTPQEYEERITRLLGELERAGDPLVLVAKTPPLDRLPRFVECQPYAPSSAGCDTTRRVSVAQLEEVVAAYNIAVERAAAETGAVVVDLHRLGSEARAAGREDELIGEDGFHPSTAGHRAVGEAFAEAYEAAR